MHIKDMPVADRPKEKLLYNGASALSTAELVALIIRTGNSEKSAVQLAEDVIAYANNEAGSLGAVSAHELTRVDGIGETKACSLIASLELARRVTSSDAVLQRPKMSNPDEIAAMLMDELRHEKREHLIALLLNAKCELEARVTVSIGELFSTAMNPREVLSPAIRRGAAGIIVVHNHPSGDPTPSSQDIESTKRLQEAAEIVGIRLYDHLVLGNGNYVSFKVLDLL